MDFNRLVSKSFLLFSGFLFLIFILPFSAQAVLPPDIIFSVINQISQIFAGLGVAIVGVFMAIVPFARDIKERFLKARKILITIGIIISICALSVTCYIFLKNSNTYTQTQPSLENKSQKSYRFFSDRFVVVGKNSKGESLLIDLNINRKENENGVFDHYYMSNIILGERKEYMYKDRVVNSSNVLPDLFFESFDKEKNKDNSSRDKYAFSFTFDNKHYLISTDELLSDFIIKNEPEYTSYISSGGVQVSVDGKTFNANVMHQSIYSSDFRKSVFFNGIDKLKSESIQLVLWDEDGKFLMVDKSNVENPSPAYTSHLWALLKDVNGYTKKSFSGDVFKNNTDKNLKFLVFIPDFENIKISLTLINPFKDNKEEGLVEGEITNGIYKKSIYGLGYNHKYGN